MYDFISVAHSMVQVVQVLKTGIGVKQSSVGERLRFGLRLQRAFDEFVRNFLPHMEEEEQVFQVSVFNFHQLTLHFHQKYNESSYKCWRTEI